MLNRSYLCAVRLFQYREMFIVYLDGNVLSSERLSNIAGIAKQTRTCDILVLEYGWPIGHRYFFIIRWS